MSKATIFLAEYGDVKEVVENLREEDIAELKAAVGEDVNILNAVYSVYVVSRDTTYVGCIDGEVVCIFGVAPTSLINSSGRPWFISTDRLLEHKMLFLKMSRVVVDILLKEFNKLENYVPADNLRAIRWLQWLGFDVYSPEPKGVAGKLFCKYLKEVKL